MVGIDRTRFRRDLQTQALRLSGDDASARRTQASLHDIGLTVDDIRAADHNQDGVITGAAEFEALYDLLQSFDARAPRAEHDLGRAEQMYRGLTAAEAVPPDELVDVGEGRFVHQPPALLERVDALSALDAPSGSGRGQEPIGAYLAAIDAREAGESRPRDVPAHLWNMTAALDQRGISSADVRHYLVTGALPDQYSADGTEVVASGADRWAELEQAATQRGSWTAVNSTTFLVNLRRSSVNTQKGALEARRDALPADDPQRAQFDAAIEEATQFEASLKRGLSSVYSAATHARERGAQGRIRRADTLMQEAASIRASDPTRADALETEAQTLRDRGARAAHAEATYRAQFTGTGWDAARTYDLAAQAQLGTGRAQVDAQLRSGDLSATPPPALTDAEDAGNGVPGVDRLLDRSVEVGGNTQSNLAIRGQARGALAVFHRAHLDQADYFATGADAPDRSAATVAHREAYLGARVDQAEVARQRLALYGPAAELTGAQATEAAAVASEERQVLEELSAVLGQDVATARALDQAETALEETRSGLASLREAETTAWDALPEAEAGIDRAVTQDRAVFGDTFKTTGEARRDDQGITDARIIAHAERQQAELVMAQRMAFEGRVETAEGRVADLTSQSTRASDDARLVRAALADSTLAQGATHGSSSRRSFLAVRHDANGAAERQTAYLDRMTETLPTGDPQVQSHRLDLARYWTTSTILDGDALGRRQGATTRLDRADALLDDVDEARTFARPGTDEHTRLAAASVEERSRLATGYASYDNGAARDQLATAEATSRELPAGSEARSAARAQIGGAAVESLVRHDGRFDEVLAAGRYDSEANDAMYRQAHAMLDSSDADGREGVARARDRLSRIDGAVEAVDNVFSTTETQVQKGYDYSAARTREIGRAEIVGAQAQVSSVISGLAWWVSLGHYDMKDEMATAGEEATNLRLSTTVDRLVPIMVGSRQLGEAWGRAREEGRPLEFMGAMRVFSDAGHSTNQATRGAYYQAYAFLDNRVRQGEIEGTDWQRANQVGVREGEIPVMSALGGSMFGIEPGLELHGDTDSGVVTEQMRDMMESQRESYEDATENMEAIIATNLVLEFTAGLVLTAGIGSGAAVANGANSLNTARTAVTAANGLRTMAAVSRTAGALRTVGTAAAVGVGMYGASYGARELFGRSSGMVRGVDVAANFIPIGAGQRAAGLTGRLARTSGRAAAVEQSAGRLAQASQALSRSNLVAHARFYAPQIALGGTQIVGTQLAMPVISERLGLRGETEQAMVGVALGALFAGGTAVGVQAMNRRGGSPLAQRSAALLAGEGRGARPVVRDVDTFLRQTDGRVATRAEADALRTTLRQRLDVPESGGGEAAATRRAQIDATVDALQIQQASHVALMRATSGGGEVTPQGARQAVEAAATDLLAARGPGASRARAYQDASTAVMRALGDAPSARGVQTAAMDRASSAEIVSGLAAQTQDGVPVIAPDHAVRAERILAEELGHMRTALAEGRTLTDGPMAQAGARLREAGLSPAAAESVLRGAQRHLVETGAPMHLAGMQAERAAPMTDAEVRAATQAFAEQAGVPPAEAQALAGDAVARAGFVDWVRSQAPSRSWSPEVARTNFLEGYERTNNGSSSSLASLSAAELRAIYPEGGAIPSALGRIGEEPGFAAFAQANPAEARVLADAARLYGTRWAKNEMQRLGFSGAAAAMRPMMPRQQPHPTRADYVVVEPGPRSPRFVPAINLRPTAALDHNGAFYAPARAPGRMRGDRHVMSLAPDHVVMRPSQLHSASGPLTSMDNVLVFSGHGGRRGFTGIKTREAAQLVADQIVSARARGVTIDHVVLDACHQRDARMFIGESNGQAFQRELDAALTARGHTAQVEVLAASKGGPTYGSSQRASYWRESAGFVDAEYTPATSSRFYVSPMELAIGGLLTAEAAGLAAAGGIAYHSMREPQRAPATQQPEAAPEAEERQPQRRAPSNRAQP